MLADVSTLVRGFALTATTFIIVFTTMILWYSSREGYEPPEEPDYISLVLFFGSYFLILISNTWSLIVAYQDELPLTGRSYMVLIAYAMAAYAVGRAGKKELQIYLKDRKEEDE